MAGCPYLPIARNNLVARFLDDKDATDLFFIDSDVGFDANAVLKLLQYSEGIVSGIYPLKKDGEEYPVKLKHSESGHLMGRGSLIQAERLPTGFMRIKRDVFRIMAERYPELRYEISDVRVDGIQKKEVYDFFNMGIYPDEPIKWLTEDYAFCSRWAKIGGTMWVDPNINFTHTGRKVFSGNLHEYLLKTRPVSTKTNQDEVSS